MAITIVKSPPKLIISRQPVAFTLQSNAVATPLRLAAAVTGINGDSMPADSEQMASFELSDYLQGLVVERGKTIDTPAIYMLTPRAITFAFKEWLGTPPVAGAEITTAAFYLLDGRVPKSMSKAFYAANASLLAYLLSSKSCLSWFPAAEYKKVLPEQKEFLNFLQLQVAGPVELNLKVSIYYTDGTTSDFEDFFVTPNIPQYGLVYFPTGYKQLGLDTFVAEFGNGRTVKSYAVNVFDDWNMYGSPVYKYEIDRNYYEHPRTLYIKNSFGLWEILLCTGLSAQENEIKSETAVTDGLTLQDKLNWKITKTDVVKVNTGFKSAAQMQWLSDLDFTEAYEFDGINLLPIVFHDLKLPVVHDGDYQYSADLEYEYSYNLTIEQA